MRRCEACETRNPDSAKFCHECGTPLAATTSEARRRLVTALFCDLVGSTALGELLDAEALHAVLDRYFVAMRAAIERHGGTVEKFIGDAVVGTFGVPIAHEDDALRAVRAALEMRQAAAGLDAEVQPLGIRVRVRIAISSGEALSDEAARQGRIGGDVFNTAARLQAAAEPDDVFVSGSTEPMLRGRVDLVALGPLELKGRSEPVDAFRVLGIRTAPSHSQTPMVGRDRALASLLNSLEDAVDANACVLVTILAPPGVGKSRLAVAFGEAVRDRATVLVGQTPSYGDGVTFAPLVELLVHAAGRPTGDAEEVAEVLRGRLVGQPDGASVADRIAQILGVGEALAADTSWAIRRLLEVLAAKRPLVVVLEDVHWAESPMLDLVDSVIDRLHGPALVLCLARPELLEQRPTWAAGKPRAVTTTLPTLPAHDARRLAELLLGKGIPPSVVDRVCVTAEGNPLYLEQLTAMLADQGLMVDGRWVGGDDAEVEIPATLQALLAARLDRLDPSTRVILERASVEGRRFRLAGLRTLAPGSSEEEIRTAIASLDRRGLVQPEDEAEGRWRFAHSLLREAAYRGLSKALRAGLHERLADWLLIEDAEQADVDESVARHLERALHLREELGQREVRSTGLAEHAGELFASAGTRAFAALDFLTARDLLGRAAALLPEGSPRRLDILPNLGVALTETGRPAETEDLLSAGVEQARAVGSERDALRARVQLLSNLVYRSPTEADAAAAVTEAENIAERFTAAGDDVGLGEAAITLEYLEFMRGRIARSSEWTLRALRHAAAAGHAREATQAAADVVGTAVFGPLRFARFATTAEESLFPLDEPISRSAGHALCALSALSEGDEIGFLDHDRRRREVVDRHGLTWLGATQDLVTAAVEIWVGRADAAEGRLLEARAILVSLGDIWWVSALDASLCAAVEAQGRPGDFLRLADTFDGSVPPVTDRQIMIRRSLVRAQALLHRGTPADAEVAARRGLELAETADLLLDHAEALLTLADVLDARGLEVDAGQARTRALDLIREKGLVPALARLGSH